MSEIIDKIRRISEEWPLQKTFIEKAYKVIIYSDLERSLHNANITPQELLAKLQNCTETQTPEIEGHEHIETQTPIIEGHEHIFEQEQIFENEHIIAQGLIDQQVQTEELVEIDDQDQIEQDNESNIE